MIQSPRLEIGTKVGNYKITRFIEQGGMGEVYEAEDLFLRRKVALKVIRSNLTEDEEIITRFFTEGQVLAKVSSKYIVQVHALASDKGIHYIAMEFVDGESLSKKIRGYMMAVEEATPLMVQIIEGVIALHANGIIHRDLKPRNIIYQNTHTVKILDFGIAKMRDEAKLNITKSGEVVGSVFYMAPEVTYGKEAMPASDIWSMGLIFYEMLTGVKAIQGQTEKEVIKNIRKYKMAFTSSQRKTIPEVLRKIIIKMCEQDLVRRYDNLLQVQTDFKHFLLTVPWSGSRLDHTDRASVLRTTGRSQMKPSAEIVQKGSDFREDVKRYFYTAALFSIMVLLSLLIKNIWPQSSMNQDRRAQNKVNEVKSTTQSSTLSNSKESSTESVNKPATLQDLENRVTPRAGSTSKVVSKKAIFASKAVELPTLPKVSLKTKKFQMQLKWNKKGLLAVSPELHWKGLRGVLDYTVQISENESFQKLLLNTKLSGTSLRWVNALPGQYFWRVRAEKKEKFGEFSASNTFLLTTQAPVLPKSQTLKSTYIEGVGADRGPVVQFSWQSSPGANNYRAELSYSSNFKSIHRTMDISSPRLIANLSPGRHYVRVFAWERGRAVSGSSRTSILTVLPSISLDRPVIARPDYGELLKSRKPAATNNFSVALVWFEVPRATRYQVQISRNNKFEEVIYDGYSNEPSMILHKGLKTGANYWRVRAQSGSEVSPWSGISFFTIE